MGPSHKSLSHLAYFTPAFVWGIFVLYFSLLPGHEVPRFMIQMEDKLLHAAIYFLSAGLIYLGFIRFNFKNAISPGTLVFILLLCVLYGGAIEIVQHYFVPRRVGEWADFLANTTGSVLCVLLFAIIHRLRA